MLILIFIDDFQYFTINDCTIKMMYIVATFCLTCSLSLSSFCHSESMLDGLGVFLVLTNRCLLRLCMYVYVCGIFKNYTIRLLLIQHNIDDDKVNDGCLLLAIGAAIGAAGLLALTIIVATAVYVYHRQLSFTAKKRVSRPLLCRLVDVLFCSLLIITHHRIFHFVSWIQK